MAVLPPAEAMAQLVSAAGLEPERIADGVATFPSHDGLTRRLVISKPYRRPGRLTWWAEAADAALEARLRRPLVGFMVTVEYPEHVQAGYVQFDYQWPASARPLDPQLVADLSTHGRAALAAVVDRRDLCLLLLENDRVQRGGSSIPFNPGNSSTRLAQALVIARDLGDAALERIVIDALNHRGDDLDESTGNRYRELVAYDAAVLRPHVPVSVDDVAAKKAVLHIRRRV
jgi:hypothetical protein